MEYRSFTRTDLSFLMPKNSSKFLYMLSRLLKIFYICSTEIALSIESDSIN